MRVKREVEGEVEGEVSGSRVRGGKREREGGGGA